MPIQNKCWTAQRTRDHGFWVRSAIISRPSVTDKNIETLLCRRPLYSAGQSISLALSSVWRTADTGAHVRVQHQLAAAGVQSAAFYVLSVAQAAAAVVLLPTCALQAREAPFIGTGCAVLGSLTCIGRSSGSRMVIGYTRPRWTWGSGPATTRRAWPELAPSGPPLSILCRRLRDRTLCR